MMLVRTEIWNRLVAVDYFDWCTRAQFKKLEALFFDGEILPHAEEYLTIRELYFHPIQTQAKWAEIIELRKVVNFNGFDEVMESAGQFYISDRVTELLKEDFQYSGMSVAAQIELADFLGMKNLKPFQQSALIAAYLQGITTWLKADTVLVWDAAKFSESKFAATKSYLYKLINDSLLIYKGRRVVLSEPVRGWADSDTTRYFGFIKLILKCVESYKIPKKLEADPTPRLAFLEAVRQDLQSRSAPQLILDVWDSTRK